MMLVLSGIIVGGFLSSVLAIMKFVAENKRVWSIVFGRWAVASVKQWSL